MTVYIKDFKFIKRFGSKKLQFRYFTGYKWKKLSVKNTFEKENVTVYSRYVLDCVVKDLCGKETDVFKRDEIIRKFDSDIMCMSQLNINELAGATKLFS